MHPMPKSSAVFVCRECGGESLRWGGQCPHCRAWNTLEEYLVPRVGRDQRRPATLATRPVPITEVELETAARLQLDWQELNRVLGGGVVPGSLVLLGGEPGVGKSTLLTHLAAQAATRGRAVLYASGEESAQQVGLRARRLGLASEGVLLMAENDLDAIISAIEAERPAITIVDSIQTVQDAAVEATPGSVSQVREATNRLMRTAKGSGTPIFLVGHVTKEGAIAGPKVLEHMVDTVLYLEGDRGHDFRILRAQKNRFGSTDEIGIFSLGERGLEEVGDPSALLLSDLGPVPGTTVLAAMEGIRPLLVELQSLVTESNYGLPRRSATGVDLNRLHMIVAVLDKHAEVKLGKHDVLVNVAGGMRVQEPAADLGLALAIASSFKERPLPDGTVVIGELGLAGEVRRVGRMERRLQEAARRGFTRAIVPRGTGDAGRGLDLECLEVKEVREAVDLCR
jgi:DNA repair protein RadA/Sms